MSITIEVVSGGCSNLGEGPVWLSKSETLLQVDAFQGEIVRIDPVKNHSERTRLGETVTFVIPCSSDPENTYVFSDHGKICKVNSLTKKTEVLGEIDATDIVTRFNDAKCDAKGRLWAGTMPTMSLEEFKRNCGSLFCYSASAGHGIVKKLSDVSLSNGMAWSSDNQIFYYIDTLTKRVDAFDYDLENANISNRRTVVDFQVTPGYSDCGLPDGMSVDTKGNLWVACYSASRVINIDPRTGTLLNTIKFPVSNITSCCFGGKDNSELFVTSGCFGLSSEESAKQPEAGSTFRVKGLGATGLPVYHFEG